MQRSPYTVFFLAVLAAGVFAACVSCQKDPSETQSAKEPAPPKPVSVQTTKTAPKPGGVLSAILARDELRVGMQVGYVPFEMVGKQGRITGFDVDTANLTAGSLGVGLNIVKRSWSELIPSLLNGEIDVIMSAMTITPKKNLEVVFTVPLLETGRMFLVHKKNAANIKNFKDLNLSGLFVSYTSDGLGDLPIRSILPRAALREFPTKQQALDEVLNGRCAGYVDEEFSIRMACAKRPKVFLGRFEKLTYEPVAWAVRPGDPHWLNWLNNFIHMIRRSGKLDELKQKWLRDYFLDLRPSRK
jgi:polar amino acid transport system substrate-binding protein